MKRASSHMPPHLRNKISTVNGFYTISENGLTYKMEFAELMKMKDYYKKFMHEGRQKFATIEGWYKDLDKFSKEKVIREGNLPTNSNDFYPDNSYE